MAETGRRTSALGLLHPPKVKRFALGFSYTLALGGISVGLTAVLALTGVLLMFGYRPALTTAFADTHALASGGYSSFLRSLHRWSAYLLMVSAFLHLARVLYHGAYKGARRINWVVGVIMLLAVVAMAMSGNILPWDQGAMAVAAVVDTLVRSVPLIGGALKSALFGPTPDATLLRAYVFHVALFPFMFLTLSAVHLWRVRRDGLSGPE